MNHWPSRRQFVSAGILIAAGGLLIVFAYVKLGAFNVAASRPHSRVVEWITHETMINSVHRRARSVTLPDRLSAAEAVRGFCEYEEHCVACHGAPAVARAQWVNGLNPAPPYLLDATRLWKPGELDWIVRNGIKMTGMPAWRESMSDAQIRNVVVFLEAMPKMQPQLYGRWRAENSCRAQSNLIGSILGTPTAHQIAPKAAIPAVRMKALP